MAHNVFLFCPAFGQVITATTVTTIVGLLNEFAKKGIGGGFSTLSFPDIAELRAMATTIWYDAMPNSSHILFIDADVGFSPDLVMDMLLLGEPVVGALYPKKTFPLQFAGSGLGTPQAEVKGYFMEVEGVGFGCTLISREAIRIMLEKLPEIIDTQVEHHVACDMLRGAGANRIIRAYDPIYGDTGRVSEDISFCRRWRQCGGRVWASIGHTMAHVGPYAFTGKYLDVLNNPARLAEMQQAQALPVANNASGIVPPVMPVESMVQAAAPAPEPVLAPVATASEAFNKVAEALKEAANGAAPRRRAPVRAPAAKSRASARSARA